MPPLAWTQDRPGAEVEIQRGLQALQAEDHRQARDHFEKAISRHGESASAHYFLGLTLLQAAGEAPTQLGRTTLLERALTEFNQSRLLDPGLGLATLDIGIAQSLLGRFEQAESGYQQYLGDNPDDPLPYLFLAVLYYRQAEEDRSLVPKVLENLDGAQAALQRSDRGRPVRRSGSVHDRGNHAHGGGAPRAGRGRRVGGGTPNRDPSRAHLDSPTAAVHLRHRFQSETGRWARAGLSIKGQQLECAKGVLGRRLAGCHRYVERPVAARLPEGNRAQIPAGVEREGIIVCETLALRNAHGRDLRITLTVIILLELGLLGCVTATQTDPIPLELRNPSVQYFVENNGADYHGLHHLIAQEIEAINIWNTAWRIFL